jgi:hypothetical protein
VLTLQRFTDRLNNNVLKYDNELYLMVSSIARTARLPI